MLWQQRQLWYVLMLQVHVCCRYRIDLKNRRCSHCINANIFALGLQNNGSKVSSNILHITSSNTDRYSKFFHYHNLQEICNKAVYPVLVSENYSAACGNLVERWTRQNPNLWQGSSCNFKWNLFTVTCFTEFPYQFSFFEIVCNY